MSAKKDISFHLGAKKQRKVAQIHQKNEKGEKEAIAVFESSSGRTANGGKEKFRVIAPLENSHRTKRSFVPSFVPEPEESDDKTLARTDRFERASEEDKPGDIAIEYGLTKREHLKERSGDRGMSQSEKDAFILKEDLDNLPPESSLQDYERMPVEAFGEALMRGLGWQKGRGIGKNSKGEVEAKELMRRPDRLGLGAAPEPLPQRKKYIKPGESREPVNGGHVAVEKSNKSGYMERKSQSQSGKSSARRMYVQHGKYKGSECILDSTQSSHEEESGSKVKITLLPSMEDAVIRRDYMIDASKADFKDDSKALQHDVEKAMSAARRGWLRANIRVKVIDKQIEDGKLYLKKGTVVDVKTPEVCDIYVDDLGQVFMNIVESHLETVVPRKEGCPILIVAGKFRGKAGRLLYRSKKSDYAAVELLDEPDVQKLHFDDIAEYTGTLDCF